MEEDKRSINWTEQGGAALILDIGVLAICKSGLTSNNTLV